MAAFSFTGFCANTVLERSKLKRRRTTLNPRPPFPPFTEETAMQRSVWRKIAGIRETLSGSRSRTRLIPLAQSRGIRRR